MLLLGGCGYRLPKMSSSLGRPLCSPPPPMELLGLLNCPFLPRLPLLNAIPLGCKLREGRSCALFLIGPLVPTKCLVEVRAVWLSVAPAVGE